jgi:glutathione synthase/RimK-type ligase-like ATP-grasp enzyme
MLVQKNGKGEWEVTGCAGRIGAARSVTSNLHGGGRAIEMEKLLRQRFASDKTIEKIRQTAEKLAMDIVDQLELEYGRLCELALDLAVDPDGHVWLIEINPKPGRNIFLQINDLEAYRTAIIRPLEYAKWLYKQLQA